MKTDELIALLGADAAPVPRRATSHRLGLALAVSLPLSVALLLIAFGPRRDLVEALFWPMFWVKLLFPLAIAAAGFVLLQRLARPGVRGGLAWTAAVAPVLLIWALAAFDWSTAAPAARAAMLWGPTWRNCAFDILALATPTFVAALWVLRSLAPTRPALAGAAAGALAGGVGGAVYAVHCIELASPFLAVWYMAGIALPVALGAVLGARLLRW
ncbi:DUF1109 domain-containing protein [Variovorax sp. ZT4R33]|uniref:DUF1109 domain-containing protein n=1 Tax=Variovorax sp. ZT4R33 TaxID=3443743 RepID=UPI003F4630D3